MNQLVVTVKPWGRWSWHWTVTDVVTGHYEYGVKWGESRADAAARKAARKMHSRIAGRKEYEWTGEA